MEAKMLFFYHTFMRATFFSGFSPHEHLPQLLTREIRWCVPLCYVCIDLQGDQYYHTLNITRILSFLNQSIRVIRILHSMEILNAFICVWNNNK